MLPSFGVKVGFSEEGYTLQFKQELDGGDSEFCGLPTDDAAGWAVEGLRCGLGEIGGWDEFINDLGHGW